MIIIVFLNDTVRPWLSVNRIDDIIVFNPLSGDNLKEITALLLRNINKILPVNELIRDKNLLFVDDSIVRGTQLRETVEFLYESGAKSVHMRSACPPIMYACKYLNFSRSNSDMELIARRVIVELEGEEGLKYIDEYADGSTERGKKLRQAICEKFNFASLEFQSLEGVIKAIGINPCDLCTYCWNGKDGDDD